MFRIYDMSEKDNKKRKFTLTHKITVIGIIVTFIGVLCMVFIPYFLNREAGPPEFYLVNPIIRPDAGLSIKLRSETSEQKSFLDVKFDNLFFPKSAELVEGSAPPVWHFDIIGRRIPPKRLQDGEHIVSVGFPGEKPSGELHLLFDTTVPRTKVKIDYDESQPHRRAISGIATDDLRDGLLKHEALKMEIVFDHDGYHQEVPIKVSAPIVDKDKGEVSFNFETVIQDLPKLSPDHPRFSKRFFAFRVTDQAGNEYHYVESYAQFIAPGDKLFGAGKIANIKMENINDRGLEGGTLKRRYVFTPTSSKVKDYLANGEVPIELKVTSQAGNINQLEWTDLSVKLQPEQPLTIIFRDNTQIATSSENKYIDSVAPEGHNPEYQVKIKANDGNYYASNTY